MPADILAAPLSRVALFQGLKPLQLSEIARRAERIVFKDGDIITAEDAPGDAAFLLVSGSAEIDADGEPGKLSTAVEVGSLIGEMAMLIEHGYGATVRAKGQVRALKITRAQMHAQMLRDPSLAEHLTGLITERLHTATEELQRIDQLLDATAHWETPANDGDLAFVPGSMKTDRALPAPLTH
jgi:CRP-like cAMP-binding protein